MPILFLFFALCFQGVFGMGSGASVMMSECAQGQMPEKIPEHHLPDTLDFQWSSMHYFDSPETKESLSGILNFVCGLNFQKLLEHMRREEKVLKKLHEEKIARHEIGMPVSYGAVVSNRGNVENLIRTKDQEPYFMIGIEFGFSGVFEMSRSETGVLSLESKGKNTGEKDESCPPADILSLYKKPWENSPITREELELFLKKITQEFEGSFIRKMTIDPVEKGMSLPHASPALSMIHQEAAIKFTLKEVVKIFSSLLGLRVQNSRGKNALELFGREGSEHS